MTTHVIIGPKVFDLLFYLLVLFIGLDYVWSGYRVIKDKTHRNIKPKLLGYWIIKRFQISDKDKKYNKLFHRTFYSTRNLGVWTFISGILCVFASGIMIYNIIFE